MGKLTARLKSEADSRAGHITAARRRALGIPKAKRKVYNKPLNTVNRIIRSCKGVPRIGRSPVLVCTQKMLTRTNWGRPSVRCGRCRVAFIYRKKWSEVSPGDIVTIIQNLAAQGLIGPGSKIPPAWKRDYQTKKERT